jgi:hypothetical protein
VRVSRLDQGEMGGPIAKVKGTAEHADHAEGAVPYGATEAPGLNALRAMNIVCGSPGFPLARE